MDEFDFLAEGVHVIEVGVYCVECVDPGSARRNDYGLAGVEKFCSLRGALGLEIGGVVLGTEGYAHHPFGGLCNLECVADSFSALDCSHDLSPAKASEPGLHLLYLGFKLTDFVRSLGLRHTDDVHACLYHGLDVLLSVRGAERIDADHHFRVTIVNALEGIVNEKTGRILL